MSPRLPQLEVGTTGEQFVTKGTPGKCQNRGGRRQRDEQVPTIACLLFQKKIYNVMKDIGERGNQIYIKTPPKFCTFRNDGANDVI